MNLVFSGNNQQQVKSVAAQVAAELLTAAGSVEVLGPSPCPLARLRGKSRFQILLKAAQRSALRELVKKVEQFENKALKGVGLYIDVDPIDMF